MAERDFVVGKNVIGDNIGKITETVVNTTTATEIYTFSSSLNDAAEFIINTKQGSKSTLMKALVNHNSTDDAKITTYGILEYGSPEIPLTVSADYLDNATSWVTQSSLNSNNNTITSSAYGNGSFVVVLGSGYFSGSDGTRYSSTDGISWVKRNTDIGDKVVAFGNNNWLVARTPSVGVLPVMTSTDTVTWVTRTIDTSWDPTVVAYGNNRWTLAGNGGLLATSTDTITWTTITSPAGEGTASALAYGNNLWVVTFSFGGFSTSTDGLTWSSINYSFWGNGAYASLKYADGKWVGTDNYDLYTSTDAVTWVTRVSNFGFSNIKSVDYGNGQWVAVGESGQLRTSTDAITWVTRTSNFGTTNIGTVVYGNNLWVAGGYRANVRTSYGGNAKVSITATITDANTTQANVKVLPTLLEV